MYVSLEWDLKLELSLNSPSGFQNALNHSLCHCCLFMYIFIYICIETHSDRQTDRETDKQTDRQTKKQIGLSKYFFVHSDDLKIPSLQEATIQELNEVIRFFQMFQTSVSWSKNGQTHWQQPTNCLSVSDHFVGLAVKWLMVYSNKKRLSWKIHKRKINSSMHKDTIKEKSVFCP